LQKRVHSTRSGKWYSLPVACPGSVVLSNKKMCITKHLLTSLCHYIYYFHSYWGYKKVNKSSSEKR
jgi:hypothetical protein